MLICFILPPQEKPCTHVVLQHERSCYGNVFRYLSLMTIYNKYDYKKFTVYGTSRYSFNHDTCETITIKYPLLLKCYIVQMNYNLPYGSCFVSCHRNKAEKSKLCYYPIRPVRTLRYLYEFKKAFKQCLCSLDVSDLF